MVLAFKEVVSHQILGSPMSRCNMMVKQVAELYDIVRLCVGKLTSNKRALAEVICCHI